MQSGVHWPINLTRTLRFLDIFNNNKNIDKPLRDLFLHLRFLICPNFVTPPFVVRKSLTNPFYHNNLYVWQFSKRNINKFFRDPPLYFSFLSCPNFVTIYNRVVKMTMTLLNIPCYHPPFIVRNSFTNKFYKKSWKFWIFSKKKLQV